MLGNPAIIAAKITLSKGLPITFLLAALSVSLFGKARGSEERRRRRSMFLSYRVLHFVE